MRGWPVRLAMGAALASLAAACASLLGVDDVDYGPTTGTMTEGGASDAPPTTDDAKRAPPDAAAVDVAVDPVPDAALPIDASCGDLASSVMNCGTCGHACASGACINGMCAPSVLAPANNPTAVALSGGDVYWVDAMSASTCAHSGCQTVAKTLGAAGANAHLAVDTNAVYWSVPAMALYRYSAATLALLPNGSTVAAPVGALASSGGGLVLAVGMSLVYCSNPGNCTTAPVATNESVDAIVSDGAGGAIWANATMSVIRHCTLPFAMGCVPQNLVPGQASVQTVAFYNGFVYWGLPSGLIGRCDAVNCQAALAIATGQGFVLGIAADASGVYWTSNDGAVRSCPLPPAVCVPTTRAVAGQMGTGQIALDDSSIYWTAPSAIMTVSK